MLRSHLFNPSMATLKAQSNRPLYSNTVTGTLAVDGWGVAFSTARAGCCPTQSPSSPTAHPSTASVPTLYHSTWHYNCLSTLKGYAQLLQLEFLRKGGLGTKAPLVTGWSVWFADEVFEIGDSDVRLFQTVTADALGGRWTSSLTLACLSLFSRTSPDVAGRRCALMLPVRSMLGRRNRLSDSAPPPDALWKQLELLDRRTRGAESDDIFRSLCSIGSTDCGIELPTVIITTPSLISFSFRYFHFAALLFFCRLCYNVTMFVMMTAITATL